MSDEKLPSRAAVRETLKQDAKLADKVGALIEAHFVARIHNSPVSRNSEIYNYVREWTDELKAKIAKEI